MGDVNGVGPEILAKALARNDVMRHAPFLVYGDPRVYESARRFAPDAPEAVVWGVSATVTSQVSITDAGHAAPEVTPGRLSAASGDAAHAWIEAAAHDVLSGVAAALVTCPINKEAVLLAGHEELGHTEQLARLCATHDWRMCLFSRDRLVVHLSGHLPLRAALDQVTGENIVSAVRQAHAALRDCGMASPRIAVAGLNPHAGEHGAIGSEDDVIIAPAVQQCRAEGLDCSGPHSPDAVFRQLWDGAHDAVIALYHDQGHIAMKMIAMDECSSLTLGLPIVRTSPDHGTAFDIAWQGKASEASLCTAIELAARLSHARRAGLSA
ncbi:MAG: hypothetical protein RLZZ303_1854 [Candidatus Hydrogenedentota bacterium]|jgi:4-hydroxythreonine-4-phosphate dehydrogenase